MKNIFKISLLAILALTMSCSSKSENTIKNLKTAADGEASASANYAKFSEKAIEEGLPNIGRMFAATSYAESRHAAKHIEELAKLGVTGYVPTVETDEVLSTLENLELAKEGEDYEFSKMYADFIVEATKEKCDGALTAFQWAKRAEGKHSKFYADCIDALNDPEVGDAGVNVSWAVCSVCGDTYMESELSEKCELCGAQAMTYFR